MGYSIWIQHMASICSRYYYFTPDEVFAYAECKRFTPDERGYSSAGVTLDPGRGEYMRSICAYRG